MINNFNYKINFFIFIVIISSLINTSTQLTKTIGGAGNDVATAITIDTSSNLYITGYTDSNPFDGQATNGGNDVFLSKFNSSGVKQWTQIIGGQRSDNAYAIIIDSSSNLYITGFTDSNIFDGHATNGSSDVFVSKFNSSGVKQWTKTIANVGNDFAVGITIDSSSNLYITGFTDSNPFDGQATNGGNDVFLSQFNSSGVKQWTKIIGGQGSDQATAITIDSSSNLYIAGSTSSNPFDSQATNGSSDVFVSKFNSSGVKQWTKIFGGTGVDLASAITIDSSSNLYITGFTASNPFYGQTVITSFYLAFILALNSNGVVQWAKTIGGALADNGNAITLDSSSNLYITGNTISNPFDNQATNGGFDVFILKFNSSGIKEWTKVIGGQGSDEATAITIDSSSNLYIAGSTSSNPFDGQVTNGNNDAYILTIPQLICDISCNGCSITSLNCLLCSSNYYKISTVSFPTQCYNAIPSYGYIFNNNSYQLCTTYCSRVPLEVINDLGYKYCDCQCPLNQVEENLICKASCQNIVNYNNSGICEPCTTGSKAHNQICFSECPNGFLAVTDINSNQYCDTSCPVGEIVEDGICKASCQNRGYIVNSQGICDFCENSNFLLNNMCISECPAEYVSNSEFHDCELCSQPLFAYNSKCVPDSECSISSILVISPNRYCLDCSKQNRFKEDNQCVIECSQPFTVANKEDVCDFCHGKYYFKNECVDECPNYTYAKIIDENTTACLHCENFIENGKCVNQCSENYVPDNNNSCLCNTDKYVLTESNMCLLNCPINTNLNETTKQCEYISDYNSTSADIITSEYCMLTNKKLENKQCVDFCSQEFTYDTLINTCVSQCESMYVPVFDGSESVCTKCDKVIENNQCVDSCSKSMAPNKDNICKPCIESTMIYKLDGKCVSECPVEYESKDLFGDKNICSLIIPTSDCSTVDCENDGACTQKYGTPICLCKEGFYGESCEYDQSALNMMKEYLNTNIQSINNINLLLPLTIQQQNEIYSISNVIKSIPELATDKLNDSIASIVYQQIQYMITEELPFQNYTFTIADYSLGIKNAL
jgi:hypothetical protein